MCSEFARHRAWVLVAAAGLMLPAMAAAQQEERPGQPAAESPRDIASQQRETESQSGQEETKTGKLVNLHEHMTSAASESDTQAGLGQDRSERPGQAQARQGRGMASEEVIYALDTGSELIILGQLKQAAAKSGGERGEQSRTRLGAAGEEQGEEAQRPGQPDREASDRSAFRRDRERGEAGQVPGQAGQQRGQAHRHGAGGNVEAMVGQEVRVQGKVHGKSGLMYMAVASIQPASGAEAGASEGAEPQSERDSLLNRQRESASEEEATEREGTER